MTRRTALKSAWTEYWNDEETRPPINHYFAYGFEAAWDALMVEIRPLVADLTTIPRGATRHIIAVERLRELVREGELGAERNPAKLGDYKIHTSLTERGNLRVKIETKDSQTEFFVSPDLTVSSDEANDKE